MRITLLLLLSLFLFSCAKYQVVQEVDVHMYHLHNPNEAVLRDVVNASTIGWDGVISVGDTKTSPGKGLDFHNLSHAYDVTPFLHHLKDTYGLLDKETHPIWSRWEHIMIDKIKKWLESKDISFTDAGYDVGVDYTDEHIWDGNED